VKHFALWVAVPGGVAEGLPRSEPEAREKRVGSEAACVLAAISQGYCLPESGWYQRWLLVLDMR
jgi:hypothetical protein